MRVESGSEETRGRPDAVVAGDVHGTLKSVENTPSGSVDPGDWGESNGILSC